MFILQLHRHDRMPQLLEVRREGGIEGAGMGRRGAERTLGITGAWIDLVIQSIRWGLCSGRACSGKTSSLIMTRDAVSILSLCGNRTANLGRVRAVISVRQCNAELESRFNYRSTPAYIDMS